MRTVITCFGHFAHPTDPIPAEAEIVTILGDFSLYTSQHVGKILTERLNASQGDLILDFSCLVHLGSTAFDVLIALVRATRAADRNLIILREMPGQPYRSLQKNALGYIFSFRTAHEIGIDPWSQLRTPIIPGQEIA